MGFSRQGYWSELPCPPPGDLPDPGIKLMSPAWQADSLPLKAWEAPIYIHIYTHPISSVSLENWLSLSLNQKSAIRSLRSSRNQPWCPCFDQSLVVKGPWNLPWCKCRNKFQSPAAKALGQLNSLQFEICKVHFHGYITNTKIKWNKIKVVPSPRQKWITFGKLRQSDFWMSTQEDVSLNISIESSKWAKCLRII